MDDLGMKLEISDVWRLLHRPPAFGHPGLKLLPQTPRSTTLRLKHIEGDGEEGDDEWR
jgi:hypothetical protein